MKVEVDGLVFEQDGPCLRCQQYPSLFMELDPDGWYVVFYLSHNSGMNGYSQTPQGALRECLASCQFMRDTLSKMLNAHTTWAGGLPQPSKDG